ncbi:hypothetical protein [Dyella terrae]|uniref:Uncharacterized protein n=1 Tax=Dyella terrae TaxID=522259 RepID=A0ABY1YXX0_9GAMM|nr:hypothetical protein [Dyella terrae]TBR40399.1 hypothetical protein EYV96_09650 [Dyella terrae]
MITAIVIALAGFTLNALPEASLPGAHLAESALILEYGPRPKAGSGFNAVLRSVKVELRGGSQHRMYVQYFGDAQFFPATGTRCTLRYRDAVISGQVGGRSGTDDFEGPVIEAFLCPDNAADPLA